MTPLATILCSVLGSSAVFGFIQYILERRDKRKERNSEQAEALKALADSIQEIYGELALIRGDMDKAEAINARVRILRASDKLRTGQKHSQEYFDQINEDISTYEKYCDDNPGFKNNKAVNAIEFVNDTYQECLRKNDFL